MTCTAWTQAKQHGEDEDVGIHKMKPGQYNDLHATRGDTSDAIIPLAQPCISQLPPANSPGCVDTLACEASPLYTAVQAPASTSAALLLPVKLAAELRHGCSEWR